jgi:hypothetical protein
MLDESTHRVLPVRVVPVDTARTDAGADFQRMAVYPLEAPPVLRPVVDDVDGLIRALFACGYTSAGILSRPDAGAGLSEQLTALIDTLDDAVRGIRNALAAHEVT